MLLVGIVLGLTATYNWWIKVTASKQKAKLEEFVHDTKPQASHAWCIWTCFGVHFLLSFNF
jgi:hypothetical protein